MAERNCRIHLCGNLFRLLTNTANNCTELGSCAARKDWSQSKWHHILGAAGSRSGYNLQFAGLELKDNNGDTVLKSSYLTIGWTVSSLYDYLVHDSGVASLVKSVTVEDPEVDLRQGQDNSWNIQDILKPSDDTNSGTFTGKVAIKNGTIAVNTANSDRYVFNDLKEILIGIKIRKSMDLSTEHLLIILLMERLSILMSIIWK